MKFLFAFATLALFAMINANQYGSNRGYGGGYGGLAYVQEPSYGHGSYGGHGGHSYAQPLYSNPSNARAAASAAASNGAIRPGNYRQLAVPGYEIDTSYNAPSRGYGSGYGRSVY
ncbi:chorion protein S15 [Drosophila innubila]|uniref:chorion protein S15 n=1 Tax=Drosophila innubila TaxID=198719 RepID=UPI00148E5AA1|nr:chorion protein S15 [Drosophila innubila]